jgi:hypothetical protein
MDEIQRINASLKVRYQRYAAAALSGLLARHKCIDAETQNAEVWRSFVIAKLMCAEEDRLEEKDGTEESH